MKSPFPQGERGAFWLGVALMITSFAIYPAYLAIALVPLPVPMKVAIAVVASMTSWAVFFAGSFIAGKRGVEYVRRLFARERTEPPAPPV